jgi:hypothetical protein
MAIFNSYFDITRGYFNRSYPVRLPPWSDPPPRPPERQFKLWLAFDRDFHPEGVGDFTQIYGFCVVLVWFFIWFSMVISMDNLLVNIYGESIDASEDFLILVNLSL